MAYLHQYFELQFLRNIDVCLPRLQASQSAEIHQLILTDIGPVFLCEKIGIDPIPSAPGNDDRAVEIPPQPLLEDSAAQIVGLAQHHLPDGGAKLVIRDERLPRRPGKPGCLENPFRASSPIFHIPSVALGPVEANEKSPPQNPTRAWRGPLLAEPLQNGHPVLFPRPWNQNRPIHPKFAYSVNNSLLASASHAQHS
jgi:hypothetical protein